VLLCKAYVNVSTDSSKGNYQKREVFWKRVETQFTTLYKLESAERRGTVECRGAEALDNRFMKSIKVDMVVFNKYYKQIKQEKPSGENDYIALAAERFLAIEGRPFKFVDCVIPLRDIPKYYPMPDHCNSDDEDVEAVNEDGTAKVTLKNNMNMMGSNMERPMGSKAAKALKRRDSMSSAAASVVDHTEVLANSMAAIAASIAGGKDRDERNDALKIRAVNLKMAYEKKKDAITFLIQLGMLDEAKKLVWDLNASSDRDLNAFSDSTSPDEAKRPGVPPGVVSFAAGPLTPCADIGGSEGAGSEGGGWNSREMKNKGKDRRSVSSLTEPPGLGDDVADDVAEDELTKESALERQEEERKEQTREETLQKYRRYAQRKEDERMQHLQQKLSFFPPNDHEKCRLESQDLLAETQGTIIGYGQSDQEETDDGEATDDPEN
jgi:hypothetical protein